jgi:hypothetical protein
MCIDGSKLALVLNSHQTLKRLGWTLGAPGVEAALERRGIESQGP